jgi:hypothetical protein
MPGAFCSPFNEGGFKNESLLSVTLSALNGGRGEFSSGTDWERMCPAMLTNKTIAVIIILAFINNLFMGPYRFPAGSRTASRHAVGLLAGTQSHRFPARSRTASRHAFRPYNYILIINH